MNINPVRKIIVPLAVVLFCILASHILSYGTLSVGVTTPSSVRDAAHTTTAPSTHSLDETVSYIHAHHVLPDYYLTKEAATAKGWLPSKGNLCDVAPGMMIGGDVFTNSEQVLPSAPGRVWHEADFDYTCGNRNAKRILYASDGLVYTTTDHYRTVTLAPYY